MLLQKRQFIPISSLEQNFTIYNMEEAASPQSQRVFPLQNCPLSIFKNILYNGCHIGSGKFCCKHFSDCVYPDHRLIGHLMVGCILMVQAHDCIYIVAIKGIYPFAYYFFWS